MTSASAQSESDYRKMSYWLETVPGSLEPRTLVTEDHSTDIAIVGAGYTGLWTAYYLSRHNPSLKISILEAQIAGFGASGRNGGWCSGFLDGISHWIDDPLNHDAGMRLQHHMFDAVDEVGRVTERETINCHYDKSGCIEIARGRHQLRRLQEQFSHYEEIGMTEQGFQWLDSEDARDLVAASDIEAGIQVSHCAAIHPARLARGLADALTSSGVQIFEHSPVTAIEGKKLVTPNGTVKADIILRATEGFSGTIKGQPRTLIPVHSMMVATEPLTDEQIRQTGLNHRTTFGDVSHVVTYGQLTADRRIAFGCRGSYYYGSGIRSQFNKNEKVFDIVRQTLLQIFPCLEGIRFTHAWGGAFGVSRNQLPAVSFDPDEGFGWAGGYAGNGVGATNLAGRTLADLVLKRDTDRCHTPWVNQDDVGRWEPEPLRWLGIAGVRQLMILANALEQSNSALSPVTSALVSRFGH